MKILFSHFDQWEPRIRKGLAKDGRKHDVTFGDLTSEDLTKYDLVVGLDLDNLRYLTSVRHLILDNPIPIPTLECINLCDDKFLFNQALMENGFGDYVPEISDKLPFPYILKKRVDHWGKNSRIVENRGQESGLMRLISSGEYFCQKLIPGRYEYATQILFKNGQIVDSIHLETLFDNELPVRGKSRSLYVKRMDHSPYLDIFGRILSRIDFAGLCSVNFKIVDNHPYIFEINPRFGGSLGPWFFQFVDHFV